MRVAIFRELPYDFPGGVSNLLAVIIDYLEKGGHEYMVFIADDGKGTTPPGPFLRFPTFTTPSWARSRFSVTYPMFSRVGRELKAFRPDVVHLLHPIVLGALGCHYARKMGIPRVVSYHTQYHDYALLHGWGFLRGTILWWLKRVFNDCHMTLAPSVSVGEFLRSVGLERILVWPRGVDIDRFNPSMRSTEWRRSVAGGRDDATHVLYVGRLAKEKNLHILTDMARRLEGVHWVVVGDGPERPALAESLRGIPHTFTGHLEGGKLATAYASADIFVMPSTTEGCPNTVMEALASGLPVLGASEFGTGELITESGAGLTFSPPELDEAPSMLEALLADRRRALELGAKGRAFAEGRSWDVMMGQLMKYYCKAQELNSLSGPAP